MHLAKVTGTIVAPQKNPHFGSAKLLIVHPVDTDGNLLGNKDMLALDPRYTAGEGDYVLVVKEGGAVRQLLETDQAPANTLIVAVVDDWTKGV